MATTTDTTGTPRPTLFLRNATGLVKAWSTFDAFLYAFWSVNLVTLGLYGMSFVYAIPNGQLLGAVLLTGVLVTFIVLTYAQLVSVMPRAGGDYAWQSRILGGAVGFVLPSPDGGSRSGSGPRSTPTSWSSSSSRRWPTRWACRTWPRSSQASSASFSAVSLCSPSSAGSSPWAWRATPASRGFASG